MPKILVVEDTKVVAHMLYFVLTAHKHIVEVAYDISDALSKIILLSPDLVILDVMLGDENGRELCKEVRVFNKTVPILLMSALPELLDHYEESGANDCMTKPFDITVLLEKVENLLR